MNGVIVGCRGTLVTMTALGMVCLVHNEPLVDEFPDRGLEGTLGQG